MQIRSNGYSINGFSLIKELRNHAIGLSGLRILDSLGVEMDFYEIQGAGTDTVIIIQRGDRTDLLLNKANSKQMLVRIGTADLLEVMEDIKHGAEAAA
jgi:hypothetical protein